MGIFKELMKEAKRQIWDIPTYKKPKPKKEHKSTHYHIHYHFNDKRRRYER